MLLQAGHRVFVESGAGDGAGFSDQEYLDAGAELVYSREELVGRSQAVIKVSPLDLREADNLKDGQLVMAFQHLAVAEPAVVRAVLSKKIALVAYEAMVRPDGVRPVLLPMSQVAGKLAAQVAAHYLEATSGGRGVLLGGLPGVPPGSVAVIGAGMVGRNATAAFLGMGAQVTVLDVDLAKLSKITEQFPVGVNTMLATGHNVARAVEFADAVVGAVLIPGARAPIVVTDAMVRRMRPRAVIVDVSIDQGGCVETSRPTTLRDPVFVEHNVVHYCVPNMPGLVPRTSTHALNNALVPYVKLIADHGLDHAMRLDSTVASGVVAWGGYLSDPGLAAYFGVEARNPLDASESSR
jgi:alanine dehydrogenase